MAINANIPSADTAQAQPTKRINGDVLGHNSDWWNGLLIWAAFAVVAAAFAVAATQYAVITAQKREVADANLALDRYKASVALQVADAQKEGIKAGEAAANADLKAAEATERAAEANERAAAARKGAAEAEARAATANERASALEKEAADARLEQERLKATLAWRVLLPGQAQILQRGLEGHVGSVNLWYTSGDPESLFFAIQFAKIFESARWNVSFAAASISNGLVWGIAAPDADGADALALRTVLKGTSLGFSTDPIPPPGMLLGGNRILNAPVLMIGSRRPTIFP
jgi:hypothetical protein